MCDKSGKINECQRVRNSAGARESAANSARVKTVHVLLPYNFPHTPDTHTRCMLLPLLHTSSVLLPRSTTHTQTRAHLVGALSLHTHTHRRQRALSLSLSLLRQLDVNVSVAAFLLLLAAFTFRVSRFVLVFCDFYLFFSFFYFAWRFVLFPILISPS